MQALTQVEEAACVEDGMHGVEGEVEAKVKANVGIGAGVEVGGNVGSKKPVESGTTAVSASTGAGVSIDTPESTPNPTPASDCDSLEPIQSTGVFRMDVSFEELEELCPMVW